MSLQESTIGYLKERREKLLNGSINTIPSPFKRFSRDFLGWEQSTYYIFTSFTKGGKSQLVSYLLFNSLLWCYENEKRTGISMKILYFNLEETKRKVMIRLYSWLLMNKYNTRISSSDLKSSDNNKPLDKNILDILQTEEATKILKYFEDHIIFSSESNPTGIHKFCKRYAEEHGTMKTKTITIKDELGFNKECQVFDSYSPSNPDEYVMCLIDTINLVETEKNYNKKQTIDKMSEYCALYLRNRYGYSPIVIQQQNTDNESIESIKFNRVRPTTAGLGDSKYTSHDANIVLGIFNPFKFGLESYLQDEHGISYNIRLFKDKFRTLEVLVNRDGELGGIIGLFFDGATCTWRELPRPGDTTEMSKVYKYLNELN